MVISEIAQKTGLTTDTLRYYEKLGLMPEIARNESGRRVYTEFHIEWIGFIQSLKSAGMTLESIVMYMQLAKVGSTTKEERKKIIMAGQNTLLEKMKSIKKSLDMASYYLENYDDVLIPQTNKLINSL